MDNVHSPNNSSVVSDILCEELSPPNKTTTLKVGPYPNTTAECRFRGAMATGRVTCMNSEGHMHSISSYSCILILHVCLLV